MYIVGEPHDNKDRTEALLRRLRDSGERLVTDAEVYQEILHKCMSTRKPQMVDAAFRSLDDIVDKVFAVTMADIHSARDLLRAVPGISARYALHVAIMRRNGISRIFSFDSGLDAYPGIERIY